MERSLLGPASSLNPDFHSTRPWVGLLSAQSSSGKLVLPPLGSRGGFSPGMHRGASVTWKSGLSGSKSLALL